MTTSRPPKPTAKLFKKRVSTLINSLKQYYYLTKPGIVRGNAITALAGFLFASQRHIDFGQLVYTLVGLSLVIASACVFNNFIDRDIDERMERTKKRALVTGQIGNDAALAYGAVLGLAGFGLLRIEVNWLAALVAFLGWFSYVVIYTKAKRHTKYSTIIGSISGSTPPVVGYCAVTGQIDRTAILLFLILVFWQMPHFYSIAIYRLKEYKTARIPLWSIVDGIKETKLQIMIFIAAFITAQAGLWAYGGASETYLIASVLAGLYWLWFGLKGFNRKNSDRWAKQMFGISLLIITIFSVLLSINAYLP